MTKKEARLSVMGAISMALKDPTLQRGFEAICKENAELKARLNAINLLTPELEKRSKLKKQQLTKASELLRFWVNDFYDNFNHSNKYEERHKALVETEQFLKEIEK